MKKFTNKESLEEFMTVLDNIKGEYKRPVMIWLWGKAVSEWAGIIALSIGFFLVFIVVIFHLIAALVS